MQAFFKNMFCLSFTDSNFPYTSSKHVWNVSQLLSVHVYIIEAAKREVEKLWSIPLVVDRKHRHTKD